MSTPTAQHPNPSPTSGYPTSRRHLDWNQNPRLAALKMLAWQIYKHEQTRSAAWLWRRVANLLPLVTEAVLGEAVLLPALAEQTHTEQGLALTPAKLYSRADCTARYGEQNKYAAGVEQAYHRIVACGDTAPQVPH